MRVASSNTTNARCRTSKNENRNRRRRHAFARCSRPVDAQQQGTRHHRRGRIAVDSRPSDSDHPAVDIRPPLRRGGAHRAACSRVLRTVDSVGLPRRAKPPVPLMVGRIGHRHRPSQSGRHRTGCGDSASPQPWPCDSRNRRRRTREQRALRCRLDEAGRALHRGVGNDPGTLRFGRFTDRPGFRVLPAARRCLRSAAAQGHATADVGRRARAEDVDGDRSVRGRLVSRIHPRPPTTMR